MHKLIILIFIVLLAISVRGISPASEDQDKKEVVEVEYGGDFIDVELGPVEQDPDKQSTLDRQYLRREVKFNIDENIDNVDFEYEVEMPGECVVCVVKFGKALVLDIGFDNTVRDSTKYGNNGKQFGGEFVTGWKETALRFNGVNDYVIIDHSQTLDLQEQVTISAWVKIFSNINKGRWPNIVGKGNSYFIRGDDDSNSFYGRVYVDGTAKTVYINDVPLAMWNHFVLTYDGYSVRSYLNGELVDEIEASGEIDSNTAKLEIGRNGGYYFDGDIDEIKILKRSLSKDEVKLLFAGKQVDQMEQAIYSSSFVESFQYNIGEPYMKEEANGLQLWIVDVEINNTNDIDFTNISAKIQIEASNIVGSNEIEFLIPTLNAGSLEQISINFTAYLESDINNLENNTNESEKVVNDITGMTVRLLGSTDNRYALLLILGVLISIAGLIEYLSRRRRI